MQPYEVARSRWSLPVSRITAPGFVRLPFPASRSLPNSQHGAAQLGTAAPPVFRVGSHRAIPPKGGHGGKHWVQCRSAYRPPPLGSPPGPPWRGGSRLSRASMPGPCIPAAALVRRHVYRGWSSGLFRRRSDARRGDSWLTTWRVHCRFGVGPGETTKSSDAPLWPSGRGDALRL